MCINWYLIFQKAARFLENGRFFRWWVFRRLWFGWFGQRWLRHYWRYNADKAIKISLESLIKRNSSQLVVLFP